MKITVPIFVLFSGSPLLAIHRCTVQHRKWKLFYFPNFNSFSTSWMQLVGGDQHVVINSSNTFFGMLCRKLLMHIKNSVPDAASTSPNKHCEKDFFICHCAKPWTKDDKAVACKYWQYQTKHMLQTLVAHGFLMIWMLS